MPYLKLSEFQAKKIFFESTYFCDFLNKNKLEFDDNLTKKYVIKVDNGTKHRMNRGLVKVNISKEDMQNWIKSRDTNENYFIEHVINFKSEIYLAIRPFNNDFNEIIINKNGGVNLDHPEKDGEIYKVNILNPEIQLNDKLLEDFVKKVYTFYLKYHGVFLEMNPIVLNLDTNSYIALDIAMLIDQDALYLFNERDKELISMNYLQEKELTLEENEIKKLDERTGGSLKFTLLNPSGNIWTLVAGGGASVLYTDAIINRGYLENLANYGEYSGDPQEDLVEAYCDNVFNLMKKVTIDKILFIGGGIANFTDVLSTFNGIIKSIYKNHDALLNTKVYIRRGGPNYKKALEVMKQTLDKYKVYNEVYGTDTPITEIVSIGLKEKEFKRKTFDNISHLEFPQEKPLSLNLNENSKCAIYGYNKNAIQRMLDFDYISGKNTSSISCIIEPRQSKNTMDPFFFGNESTLIPIYNRFSDAIENKDFDCIICFMSFRSVYETCLEILNNDRIKTIVIIAEGVPELLTRKLNAIGKQKKITIIGPATVGGIIPGQFRIANTGGSLENILENNLYKKGTVGLVSRSGGLLNELCSIISKNTHGIHSGISIGGDRYPGSNFIDYILSYEENQEIKMHVFLGEVGGIQEILIANAVKSGLIKKPIIGYCSGISSDYLSSDIQFGHAGASATASYESANFKNLYMKNSGIQVPKTFEEMPQLIHTIYSKLNINFINETKPRLFKDNRVLPTFFSSISNENGEELEYNHVKISDLLDKGIGKTIGHLWLKKDLPDWFSNYIELILIVTSDHGGMVSGAHNTMIASRAGKDLISSLCSGLLTIGDYFGGALNDSAKQFKMGFDNYTPKEFIEFMKKSNRLIMGIGHKIKSVENPDRRVEILKEYVFKNFPKHDYVDYAHQVEKLTTQKKNNLILNVDGFIANSLLDAFTVLLTKIEFEEILENDFINAFFILGRTIGFIGHWYDQKRLKQGLFRLNPKDIQYL
jgi:ATP citrate (pro-S)-lyase